MADNTDSVVNGGVNGDTTPEFFDDTDFPPLKTPPSPSAADLDRLNKRIADLEKENSESKSRIAELKAELEKVKSEKEAELEKLRDEKDAAEELSATNSKAAEMIAKRADELEGEVSRLQHDFITATNDVSESNRQIQQLNIEIADLKREKAEVEKKVKVMELKMEDLVTKSAASDEMISGFMQKIADREVEAEALADAAKESGSCSGGCDEVWKSLKEKLPMIGAVSAGVVIAGGVMCYVRHSRN